MAGTAAEINVDPVDAVHANHDEVLVPTVAKRAILAQRMAQLDTESQILERHPLKVSVLPFLNVLISTSNRGLAAPFCTDL